MSDLKELREKAKFLQQKFDILRDDLQEKEEGLEPLRKLIATTTRELNQVLREIDSKTMEEYRAKSQSTR